MNPSLSTYRCAPTFRWFAFFATIAAACLLSTPLQADERPPNIVLIMADDMGYECVQANGGETYQTPRLNTLAKEGMLFRHCHSQPICTPSRVQLMTGIYNNRNYIKFGLLDPKATTFGHVLKKAGYKTCIAGKWQLLGGLEGPHHFGFDRYCLWQLTRRPSRYANPGLEVDGKLLDFNDGGYGPDVASDYLCDFMEEHRDKPFFVYYPMILPHWPFEPTPDSDDWDPKAKGANGKGKKEYFADMVAYTDKMVGKLVDKIDELKLTDDTIILFTGDNGTYTGITSKLNGKPYQGGKGSPKDNGTHVPFIARWPGKIKAGAETDQLVDFSDFLPTVADIAGAKTPDDIDGQTFLPTLLGESSPQRNYIYCWYHRDGVRNKATQHVRNQAFKLYANGKFFHVAQDPTESQPLNVEDLTDDQSKRYDHLSAMLKKHTDATEKATPVVLKKQNALKTKQKKSKEKKQ